jgi:hypothetical protein
VALIPRATDRVAWRGVWLDRRTASALNRAEKLVRKRTGNPLITFSPSQGGWSDGSLSGDTHLRAGVFDLRVGLWGAKTRIAVLHALRDVGIAAYLRTAEDGFDDHIHGVSIPPPGQGAGGWTKDIRLLPAPGALAQIVSYDAGRNGLRSNAKDRNPYRPVPKVRWSWLQRKAVRR